MAELKKPGLLIVDAWTKWAGPCESMHNFFKKLRNEFGADIRSMLN